MNFESLMFMVLLGLGFIWLSFFLRKKVNKLKKSEEKDENSKIIITILTFVYRGIWMFLAIFLLFMVERFGFVDIPNPIAGPMNDSPSYTDRVKDPGPPPELEGVQIKPNLQEIRSEHQKQLDDFEEKKQK